MLGHGVLSEGFLSEPTGQGWRQVGELALAFVLSAGIGLERELRQKSAGLRTHTLVGFASALIMLVSKYGFTDVLGEHVVLDPSRVAAQIVSGIGFLGAGLIFVRRDAVRGLTTAAVVWLTAAVGMAAGAGLPLLALVTTAGHFAVVFGLGPLAARLPGSAKAPARLRVEYWDGRGILREVLARCTGLGFVVGEMSTAQAPDERLPGGERDEPAGGVVSVRLTVRGPHPVTELVAALSEIDGVLRAATLHGLDE